MKKVIFSMALALLSASNMIADDFENATTAVSNMGLGWNLGNTLDANGQKVTTDVTSDDYWGCQGLDSETYWGQPKTTEALIKMMKNAGFGAIRVPVTWYNHMDKDGNVNAEWMARVKEVVDYVIGNGLYCIINVHHDTGADSDSFKSWLKADVTTYDNQKDRYEYLWKQIAEEFKDYDQHLLFESYNEMLDVKNSWCFASFNTTGQYNATIATSAYKAINSYAQSFVNSVRATGGSNSQRNLIVNTYAACCGAGTWNTHLSDPLTQMELPEDNVQNHIIFEVHDYPAIAGDNGSYSMQTIKDGVNQTINSLNTNLVSKGAPVIVGEWGTSNVDKGDGKTDYDLRRDLMKQFCEYFIQKCKENNIATFYWMGLSDGTYRTLPAFNQADLAECLAKAYHGSDYEGEYPTAEGATTIVAFEGEKALDWGENGRILIPAGSFQMVGTPLVLSMNYQQTSDNSDDIQLYYGDWSSKPSFTVDGTTKCDGDLNPHTQYSSTAGSEHTSVFTFDDATTANLAKKGLVIFGTGVTVYKAVLSNSTTGIVHVYADETSVDANAAIYNLAGQRVDSNYKGIAIKNGKKYLMK